MELNKAEFGILSICAIRYCQGRQTYMPQMVRDIIRPHLSEMSNKDISVMLDDCDFQASLCLFGSESIDKPGWELWKQELSEEKERRKSV